MELVCITLHKDGSLGVLWRNNGKLMCTCGWNEGDEDEGGAGRDRGPRTAQLLLG